MKKIIGIIIMVIAGMGIIAGLFGVYSQIICIKTEPPLSCGMLPAEIGLGFWSLPLLAIGYVIYRKGKAASYSIMPSRKRLIILGSILVGLLVVCIFLVKLL